MMHGVSGQMTGTPDASMPYARIANGSLQVEMAGLPPGISLKKPNFYSREQLESILRVQDQLTLTDK
mgnify:CR=1 FL=1|jgi:hypothetical protein